MQKPLNGMLCTACTSLTQSHIYIDGAFQDWCYSSYKLIIRQAAACFGKTYIIRYLALVSCKKVLTNGLDRLNRAHRRSDQAISIPRVQSSISGFSLKTCTAKLREYPATDLASGHNHQSTPGRWTAARLPALEWPRRS